MMNSYISLISILVNDYDEAVKFYVEQAGFYLVSDEKLSSTKRWVVVRPSKSLDGTGILLAKAEGENQLASVGNQYGGRTGMFLKTFDFNRDYERMKSSGVLFLEEPRDEVYGKVVVWQDLYGNKWDLIQHTV